MKLPRIYSDNNASESLIKYLTDPARLMQYENLVPGCTQQLLKEAQKQLSHNRKRFWAQVFVALILGLFAIEKGPVEILRAFMAGLY